MQRLTYLVFILCLGLSQYSFADSSSDPEPQIISLDEIHLIGDVFYGNPKRGAFASAWDRFLSVAEQMPNQKHQEKKFAYGVNIYRRGWRDTGKLYYMTAVQTRDSSETLMMFFNKTLPASEYAVFDLPKGERPGRLYRYIYDTWLPESGYKNPYPFDFERYDEARNGQVFVPIAKR